MAPTDSLYDQGWSQLDCRRMVLNHSKLFQSLEGAELSLLQAAAQEKFFSTDAIIFKEGDQGDGIYIVKSGLAVIYALIGEGQTKAFAKVGPGDFFGEMAVLDHEPRSATVIAEEPTTVYFIPREKMLEMLEQSPRLAVGLLREFSLKMRDFNRKFIAEVIQAERLTVIGKFARSIVHDFKNPLNVIGLAAELVKSEVAPPGLRKTSADRILTQVDRLTRMINELLEFSSTSSHTLAMAEVSYSGFLQDVLLQLEPEMHDRKVKVVCESAAPEVKVRLDRDRLMRVFANLFGNAADAMPQGGHILLRFERTGSEVLTEIEDTGKGFAPEIVHQLFEPFATHGKAHGTGLGLSICKRIIEDHRGWIKKKVEPGRGAIFVFGLPVCK